MVDCRQGVKPNARIIGLLSRAGQRAPKHPKLDTIVLNHDHGVGGSNYARTVMSSYLLSPGTVVLGLRTAPRGFPVHAYMFKSKNRNDSVTYCSRDENAFLRQLWPMV